MSLKIKWWYSSGADYEYTSSDAAKLGELFRLKVLEPDVQKVIMMQDDVLVISWTRQDKND